MGGERGPLASIHLEVGSNVQDPAVTLEVTGADEQQVDALLQELFRIFRRGRQRPSMNELVFLLVGLIAGFLALAVFLPEWLGYSVDNHLAPGGVLIVILTLAAGVLVVVSAIVMHPALELLAPGAKPRRDRLSPRVGTILLFLAGLGVAVYFGFRP